METKLEWKNKNREYLNAIEKFLDKAANIECEKLREDVIGAALKCDEILTNLAMKEINKNK